MTTKLRSVLLVAVGVSLGVAACASLIWNPAGWFWVERLLGRTQSMDAPAAVSTGKLYTCGMHPQVVESEPGNCPICGMRLVPMSGPETDSSETGGERKVLYWRAPMDPTYTSDKPGKSPMGMDLVPVYEDEAAPETGVRVSKSFLQNFGVRTEEVQHGSMPVEIRTVGILTHNEENIISVNTKFEGWIEKAFVNNLGEQVRKGEVLFEIYSPQLVTTQQEYLAALDYVERLTAKGAYAEAVGRAKSLLDSARERLRYWDVSAEQIAALEETKQVLRTVSFASPASGQVVDKMGDSLEGMKVSPGMTVLKLASHRTLWAEAEFFEPDIRHLRMGQPVMVEVAAFPGRRWSGTIALFRPALDPKTRTLTALVEVDNQDLKLQPQMYADILVRAPGVAHAVVVPQQSVIHSGERAVVVVAKAEGLFEPREVELGMTSGDMQQVTAGLAAGEKIVTSSQFLIDSESNLKAAISQLLGDRGSEAKEAGQEPSPVSHQH